MALIVLIAAIMPVGRGFASPGRVTCMRTCDVHAHDQAHKSVGCGVSVGEESMAH